MALLLPPHDAGINRLFSFFLLLLVSTAVAAAGTLLEVTVIRQPTPTGLPAELLHRSDDLSCPSSEYSSCGSQVPSNFCCPSDSKCLILAANTTLVCCPNGDCNTIKPIVCNVKLQDASKHPGAPILTTALDRDLPRCGSACCPFGYVCNNKEHCVKDADQEDYEYLVPEPSTTSSTPVTTSLMYRETSAAPDAPKVEMPATTSTAPTESSTPESKPEDSGVGPAGLVTATTVAGVCCFAGIGIFIWMKWGRKKRRSRESFTHHRDSGWGSWSSWKCFPAPDGQSPLLPRHLVIKRGLDDKFIVTPGESEFSPRAPPVVPRRSNTASPAELPASPVSLCMWQNLENAEVKEPQLAYVVPAKRQMG
ncbi:Fc.00g050400.m01.CDS01 [Cosmosporella sp. VM-42]